MGIARNVVKNTFVLGFAQVIAKVLGVVFIALLARHMGAAGVGKLAFAASFVAVVMIFANFGFDTLMVRDIARDKTKTPLYFINMIYIKCAILVVICLLLFIACKIISYPADTTIVIYILAAAVAVDALTEVSVAVFRAFEKMEYEAFIHIAGTFVYVGLGIAAIVRGYPLTQIVMVFVLASLLKLLLSVIFLVKKFMKIKFAIDIGLCKQLVSAAIPFGILTLITIIFTHTDKIMLSMLKGDSGVGYYFAADKIITVLFLVPTMYMHAIFPVFSRLYVSSKEMLEVSYRKSFDYLFVIGLPIAVGIFMIADWLIPFLYGPGFDNSVSALRILIWVVVFSFVGFANGALLNATGRQRFFAITYGVAIVLNIILNYIFIIRLGYMGACIATLIVTGTGFLFYSTVCHYVLRIPFSWNFLLKCLVSSVTMAVFIYGMKLMNLYAAFVIIGAPIIYCGILYLLKTFSEEDIAVVRNVLRVPSTT